MNEEISGFLVKTLWKSDYHILVHNGFLFHAENEFSKVIVRQGNLEGLFFFELYNLELREELIYHFPLPETLKGFQTVCNVLKVFHSTE